MRHFETNNGVVVLCGSCPVETDNAMNVVENETIEPSHDFVIEPAKNENNEFTPIDMPSFVTALLIRISNDYDAFLERVRIRQLAANAIPVDTVIDFNNDEIEAGVFFEIATA
jgi:hypothetical protein